MEVDCKKRGDKKSISFYKKSTNQTPSCNILHYVLPLLMIATIRHKALRLYFEEGNGAKLPNTYLKKIAQILTALEAVVSEDDIKALGYGVHKLSGNLKDFWSITVSANYRIIFRYEEGDILDVDYIDYH